MKKEVAALSLALALTVGMTAPASAAGGTFADVPAEHWAYAAVEEMASRGVVSGVGENCYAPDNTVSYAEFATMIARSFYGDSIGPGGEAWYSAFLDTVTQAGAVKGTRLEQDPALAVEGITRYDMAQVMYNVMSEKGAEIPGDFDTTQIGDWSAIPAGYQKAVSACYSLGTLSGTDGKGTFSGNSVMTRAQAAVVMDRLLEVCSGGTPSTPVIPEKPAGSLQLTEDNILHLIGDGSKYEDGVFYLNNSGFEGVGGYIEFDNTGYSTLTFTATVYEKDHRVTVVGADGISGDGRLIDTLSAGTTKTYSVDISGIKRVELGIFSGRSCNAEVTNIYLN
ncbi:MAG: S-layer homology domain-containing protein [Flavonifractor plautii]|nr:S-layer homology domain-containing protein [Flavonifractor plautii]